MDSNHTLKFPRTAREAYGHDIAFDDYHRGDAWVGYGFFFIVGFLLGGWLL